MHTIFTLTVFYTLQNDGLVSQTGLILSQD